MNNPVVILDHPQMGENIGAAARAMLNCGLNELRLVAPRDGWPSERAEAMSAKALETMPPVKVFATLAEAVADLHHLYATTARPRDLVKEVMNAREAAADSRRRARNGERTGFIFGAERTGLTNDDVALAHSVITIPVNPDFSSLNVAAAVLLVTYEWFQAGVESPGPQLVTGDSLPATQGTMDALYRRLEDELERFKFFRSPEMRPTIVRNLRGMLGRAKMTEQEANTFQGIISALTGKKL